MHLKPGMVVRMGGLLFLLVIFILVAGCTGPSTRPPAQRTYTPQTTILIGSASVNPQIMVVDRGVTVTWLNTDMGLHTIISDKGNPESFLSYPLADNDEFQWTFTMPGTYGYHCTDNPNIKGTIIVSS
jgi:plastocyanin